MRILVTGATGTVGGRLIDRLLQRQAEMTVLMRNPDKTDFPSSVKKIQGDLSNASVWADALTEIDCLFLLLIPEGDSKIIQYAENAGVKRIVALSDGTKYSTENALYHSKLGWTILHPVEFMKNTLTFWQKSIRADLTARTPFPDSKGALIHEADIAEAAEAVLCEPGHEGKSYVLTGPEVTTPRSRIADISRVLGKPIKMIVQSEAEAREEYAAWGFTPELIDYAIESSKNPDPYMYLVQPTVLELTGHAPRPFFQWVLEHKNDFA